MPATKFAVTWGAARRLMLLMRDKISFLVAPFCGLRQFKSEAKQALKPAKIDRLSRLLTSLRLVDLAPSDGSKAVPHDPIR
jgi:hypothetical protein